MLHLLAALLLATTSPTPPSTSPPLPPATGETVERWEAAFRAFAAHEASDPPDRPTFITVRVLRVLDLDVKAPLERVFAAFSNVEHHYQRHALLRGATTWSVTPRDDLGAGIVERRFTAIEDVPIGPLTMSVSTYARVRVDARRHRFTTESWTEPATLTRQLWTFVQDDNGVVHVHETILFESNTAFMPTVVERGIAAHTALFAALKRDLEAGVL